MKIHYRLLRYEELEDLSKIDRKQKITKKYRLIDDKLVIEDLEIDVEKWDEDELEEYITRLKNIYENSGFIYGAFNNINELVGLAALDTRYLDLREEYINLDMIYISNDYRNSGIGRTLVEKIIEEGKKTDAKYIYISSSDFKETVDFYFKLGGEITSPIDSMYEKEPEDIHMRIELKR